LRVAARAATRRRVVYCDFSEMALGFLLRGVLI
jgi:hypothetical protein